MCKFIKEKHIELSDGDTYIVSNDNCPLTEKEAKDLDICIEESDRLIPCCACTALMDYSYNFQCPHYFGYINSKDKGESFDCALLEPRKSMLK